MVEPGTPQMTILRMRIAVVYLRLQTETEYVILITIPLQKCLYERASLLRHSNFVGLVMVYAGKN